MATRSVTRVLMARTLTPGELELLVNFPLGAGHATILALASGITLRVLLCPHHEPTSVEKELLRRPEGTNGFRSWCNKKPC